MKQNKKNCDLKSCVLCTQVLNDWLPAIDANRKCLHFNKGELLFQEGAEVTGMYFINTGLVKVHKKWSEDKELILRIAKSGEIVGHRGLGSDTIYPVSATALEPTDICFISLDFFESTVKVNHDFLYRLMMFFAAELKESEKRMRDLAHMSAKGRIANALLFLKQKFGTTGEGRLGITISRSDMASYTGTTYETLLRMMSELSEEGIIITEGKNIIILKEDKLLECTATG
jgi:CRP/FNR family transcriptional regulator